MPVWEWALDIVGLLKRADYKIRTYSKGMKQRLGIASALLVPRGVVVLDPRGELFTDENISERLSVRNFMQELRESGVMTGGPGGFSAQDRQQFAAALDRELTRLLKPGR